MTAWYGDPDALRFIGRRYLPALVALSLTWEVAQLPLYALWRDGTPSEIAFAVLHCTAGDLLIGTAALVLVLSLARAESSVRWRWPRVALATALVAAVYTAVSESVNTALGRWTYSEWMPVLRLGSLQIGLSPLLQWLVVPPLALYLGRRF